MNLRKRVLEQGMRVLIFGNGYLGNKFQQYFKNSVISSADICDPAAIRTALLDHAPDAVMNCAGKTGRPNIDWCEDHKLETMRSNVAGPLQLATMCLENNLHLTHIGSGCVYQGDNAGKGYSEEDPPNFFDSFYSRTKIWSEQVLREFPVLQVRLRMPLDSYPNPRNLITKLTSYPRVISVPNSISILDDFIPAAAELMNRRRTGIYNVTNPGAIAHKQILDLYTQMVNPAYQYHLMSVDELHHITKAKRSNCVLNTDKLASEGIRLRPVEQAVQNCLRQYRQTLEQTASIPQGG